jgi:hypothetical protein
MDKIEELKVKIRKKLDKKREEKLPEPHPFLYKYKKERLKQKLIRDVIIKPNHEIVLSSGRTTNIYICRLHIYTIFG